MGAVSDENCDWFHQDISQIEKRTVEDGVQVCWLTAFGVL